MSSHDVAKNTLYLTAASIGQKALSFFYFLLIARVMQPEATGSYFLALSVVTIALTTADFGINNVLIREIAKDDVHKEEVVKKALGVKVFTVLIGAALAVVLAHAFGYSAQTIQLVWLAMVVLGLDTGSQALYSVLRGLRKLQYEAIGLCIGMTMTLAVGAGVLLSEPSLPGLIVALMAGSLFNVIYAAVQVARVLGKTALVPSFDGVHARALLKESWPFLLAGLFVKAYGSIDVQFLNVFLGEAAVGLYSVAYKYTYAFQFLPLAFVAALYPGMSARVGKDPEGLERLFDRALWYMLLLSVPLACGLWAISPHAVALVGSAYADAAPILAVLGFALIPSFLDFPLGSLLNASGRQRTKTAIFGVTMVINGVLNVLLIPPFGMMGAVWASLISLSALVVMGALAVKQLMPQFHWKPIWLMSIRFSVAGAVMAIAARATADAVGEGTGALVAAVLVGMFVYPVVAILTKAITRTDLQDALSIVRKTRV